MAVIVCDPAVSPVAAQLAVPDVWSTTAAHPGIVTLLSAKVIVPENLVLPDAPETVARNVTPSFTVDLFAALEEVTATVELAWFTVCVNVSLLVLKLPSCAKVALML